jgi:hypothetical protein
MHEIAWRDFPTRLGQVRREKCPMVFNHRGSGIVFYGVTH